MRKDDSRFSTTPGNAGAAWRHPWRRTLVERQKSAFTLIELLVVISVIALLMGILLPSLNLARKQAQKIACLSNMRQMGLAVQAYLLDSDYHLPPSSCRISDPNQHWLRILTRYTGENLLFRCPSDRAKNFVDWNKPLSEQPDGRYSSFAINALLDPVHYRYGIRFNKYNNVNKVRHPTYCIWVSEAPNTANFMLADHIHPEQWEGSIDYAKQSIAWDRHRGTSNYLFVDGHAANLKFDQTYSWPTICYWFPESAPKWPDSP
jgi:prepilin-type processing-associated H-X9-DG protein/prepilin-type N-terminal cleavage/methylation domain-containing protein